MSSQVADYQVYGTFAARPTDNSSAKAGRVYHAYDIGKSYRDNGTTWDDITGYRPPSFMELPEVAAPSTPASGFGRLYVKSDGLLYWKDDAGVERAVGTGAGTVTSVAMTVPSILSVAGTPITGAGTFAVSLANQSANLVFAGPASGSAAAPTMRALVAADIPRDSVTYVTNANLTLTAAHKKLVVNASSSSCTLTFPLASSMAGQEYHIVLVNNDSTFGMAFARTGSDTFGAAGATSDSLGDVGTAVIIFADATNNRWLYTQRGVVNP